DRCGRDRMARAVDVAHGVLWVCVVSVVRFVLFFFSSRRRHTRLVSDWSSDVCSSDLRSVGQATEPDWQPLETSGRLPGSTRRLEIGRASCRERVEISVVGGSLKKKKRAERRAQRDGTDARSRGRRREGVSGVAGGKDI